MKQTTIRLNDDWQHFLEQATKIVADGPNDDPPTSLIGAMSDIPSLVSKGLTVW